MKILHIDNCPKNAALIKATFDKDTVHHVQTGSQALEKLDLYKYNIIIMETCLDTVNGYQLMKHIRRFDRFDIILERKSVEEASNLLVGQMIQYRFKGVDKSVKVSKVTDLRISENLITIDVDVTEGVITIRIVNPAGSDPEIEITNGGTLLDNTISWFKSYANIVMKK